MTEWTTHAPAFDGDAPEGVGLDTHIVQRQWIGDDSSWMDVTQDNFDYWEETLIYRYLPRNPPATYAQVKAYYEQHGYPVPPKPVDYEAWEPVLSELNWDKDDKANVCSLIAAMRVAINSPACMEAISD